MKIFHTETYKETENGKEVEKEVVYVQKQDIAYLIHEIDMPIPASVYLKVLGGGATLINDFNRFDFVKFDKEEDVKFFKELDFIIDLNQYKDLTYQQLEEEEKKIVTKLDEIAEKWNNMSEDERIENKSVLEEHHNLDYMLKFLDEIYAVKHGERKMPFPEFVKIPSTKKKRFSRRKKDVK